MGVLGSLFKTFSAYEKKITIYETPVPLPRQKRSQGSRATEQPLPFRTLAKAHPAPPLRFWLAGCGGQALPPAPPSPLPRAGGSRGFVSPGVLSLELRTIYLPPRPLVLILALERRERDKTGARCERVTPNPRARLLPPRGLSKTRSPCPARIRSQSVGRANSAPPLLPEWRPGGRGKEAGHAQ